MTDQFKGDKDAFLQHIKTVILAKSDERAKAREAYEEAVLQPTSTQKDWLNYINFEESQGELKRV